MSASILGLDIGGANLKAAHSTGGAWLQPFPLWKNPPGLVVALRDLLQRVPGYEQLAVTMTGELCDCFGTKREGVNAILDAVVAAAGSVPVRVWQTNGRFVDVAAARCAPLSTGAANWLALATYVARLMPDRCGVLLDAGSTTTDVVPFAKGDPMPVGRTDFDRLHSHELIYTGVRRTPVCALLGAEGAAELFATTLDIYLVLGDLPEDKTNCDTADGRPATKEAAYARLARMLCTDLESFSPPEIDSLARRLNVRQLTLLQTALRQVAARLPKPAQTVVLAGSGEFLARAALQATPSLAAVPILSLAERASPGVSEAACAYALAMLATDDL
jgi:probable H4MPT-linked C1 transfer pathway protein